MEIIKIAICDDEPNIRSYLISLIQQQNYKTDITEYASAEAYLTDRAAYDILFLDIELQNACSGQFDAAGRDSSVSGRREGTALSGWWEEQAATPKEFPAAEQAAAEALPGRIPPISGLELARRIRFSADSPLPLVIFVTGHERYVYDAFDVDAFQYLLKPVDERRFTEVFRRAAERAAAYTRRKPKKLLIQYAGTSRTLSPDEIYYLESQGHKILLHLKDTTLEYYAKLGELEQTLQGQFSRIHKGFLVNLAYVEEYSRTEVVLTNGEKLNLSKYKYDGFVKAYLRFLQPP